MNVTISPVQWTSLKDIDDVTPLNSSDAECLAEIREILKKHNVLNRFGIALLHSHFHVAPDEVLLETSDEEARTLILSVVKEKDADHNRVGTIFQLLDGDVHAMTWCRSYCKKPEYWQATSHKKAHKKEK